MPRRKVQNDEDFAGVLNNIKGLTLGQVFQIIKKIKYTTAVMLFAMFSSCVSGAFVAGQYAAQKDTAVMLESPFAMRLQLGDEQHDFNNLTLIKDPMMPTISSDKVVLSLREIKNEFDIIPLGKVVATVEEKDLSLLWEVILSSNPLINEAYAQSAYPVFNWNGHQGDYKFKEEFVESHLVYRYYSDGCILSYEVDENRRSIPETFRWVERTH